MVISVSNEGIHRYKYIRRKIYLKRKKSEEASMSFGEVLVNIQDLKEKGIISVASVNSSNNKAVKNYKGINRIRW